MNFRDLFDDDRRDEYIASLKGHEERAVGLWKSIWRAQILWLQGDVTSAVAVLSELAESGDSQVAGSARLLLGEIEEDSGNLSGALEWYKRAEGISSEQGAAKYSQGRIFIEMNNLDEAAIQLAGALSAATNESSWLEMLIRDYVALLRRTGRITEVTAFLEEMVQRFPQCQGWLSQLADPHERE